MFRLPVHFICPGNISVKVTSHILNESIFSAEFIFTFFTKMSLKLKTMIDSHNINIYQNYINTEKVTLLLKIYLEYLLEIYIIKIEFEL